MPKRKPTKLHTEEEALAFSNSINNITHKQFNKIYEERKMSKEYKVAVPLYGVVEVYVEAESKEEAEEIALDDCMNIDTDCSEMWYGDNAMVLPYRTILAGNTCYVNLPCILTEELEGDDCFGTEN